MKLVVTIPAQNEEKTIAGVVRGVPREIDGISEIGTLRTNFAWNGQKDPPGSAGSGNP